MQEPFLGFFGESHWLLAIIYNSNCEGLPNHKKNQPFIGGIEYEQDSQKSWIVSPWARNTHKISKSIYKRLKDESNFFNLLKLKVVVVVIM